MSLSSFRWASFCLISSELVRLENGSKVSVPVEGLRGMAPGACWCCREGGFVGLGGWRGGLTHLLLALDILDFLEAALERLSKPSQPVLLVKDVFLSASMSSVGHGAQKCGRASRCSVEGGSALHDLVRLWGHLSHGSPSSASSAQRQLLALRWGDFRSIILRLGLADAGRSPVAGSPSGVWGSVGMGEWKIDQDRVVRAVGAVRGEGVMNGVKRGGGGGLFLQRMW